MAEWRPDARDGLDRLVADLIAMFEEAERDLRRALATQARAGLKNGDGPDVAFNLQQLRRDAEAIARTLEQAMPDEVARVIAVAAEGGVNAALQELSDLAGIPDISASNLHPGAGAAEAMRADLTSALDDVVRRVLRYPNDVYRTAVANSAHKVVLGQGTGVSVQQDAWNALLRRNVTGFRDKAGRQWQLSTYVEMAVRSATRRAWDDAKVATMQTNGINLVSIVVGSGSCAACARWSGKILRTDGGPTGRITVDSAADGKPVEVHVAGSLNDAKRQGWRHPNCRCSTVAYLPGMSVVTDVTHYDPKAEADRARLRELERRVRHYKTKAAIALDPRDADLANAKVRELQAQIREHVKETGLVRQRRREQINLDNRRA